MTKISPILRFEFRRNITRSHAWIAVVLIVTSLVIFQLGIGKYQSHTRMQPGFMEIEATKIRQHPNYTQFLLSGFRILSEPSPLIALFHNSTAFGDLVGMIDNGTGLKVSNPQVGGNVFSRPTGGILDLSWYLLIIGGLLFLYFGFSAFGPGNRDFIKLLLSFAGPRAVFIGILLGRFLLLSLVVGIIVILLWLQLFINGIPLSPADIGHLLVFFVIIDITMCLLFILGSILGTVKNRMNGGLAAVVLWLGLLLLWPELLNSLFSRDASVMKPIFEQEAKKLKVLVAFERKVFNNIKEYKTPDERNRALREMSDHYLNNEFKEIEKLEAYMIERIAGLSNRFHFWSIFNPATLYRAVNNELSSRGYNSYITFGKELQKVQRAFLVFADKKRLYEKDPVVKPYLKGEEYIFKLESSLPHYFGLGVVLNIFYVFVVLGIGYFRFKRVVFPKPGRGKVYETMDLRFESGKYYTINCDNEDFKAQVFNVFCGRADKLSGKIAIDGKNVVPGERQDFLYLPGPEAMPGETRVKAVISLISGLLSLPKSEIESFEEELAGIINKRFIDLDRVEYTELLLKIAGIKKAGVYLFTNYLYNIPDEKLVERITAELKSKNSLIIELTAASPIIYTGIDRYSVIALSESDFIETKYRGG